MRVFSTALALLTTLAPGRPASQPPLAALVGRVEIQRPLYTAARPVAANPDSTAVERVARRLAVVYFQSAPSGAFEHGEEMRARMDQRHEMFVPHLVAIHTGGVVDFPNNDQVYHNVFSLSKVRRFDLGRYAAGRSKAVRFDKPGIVRVFCDIHSHMNAYILVFAHRFFAATDEEGRYRIEGIPPGTYNVTVWYEGSDRETRVVSVPASGGMIEQNFVVR